MVDKVQMILQRFKTPKSRLNRLYREGFLDNVEVGAVTARDAYGGSPGPGPSGRQIRKKKDIRIAVSMYTIKRSSGLVKTESMISLKLNKVVSFGG